MKTFQKAIDCGLTLVTVGGTLAPVSSAFASEVEKKKSVDKKSRLNDFENVTGAVDE